MKKHIPNFITLLNLLSGCISIVFAFSGSIRSAAYLIFLATLFDFLDGSAARILRAKSEIGKQLDSLADIVSFGVAPGIILYLLIDSFMAISGSPINHFLIPYIAFILPLCSALRLAKFNIDPNQEEIFLGLPTPATALVVASLPLIISQEYSLFDNHLDSFISFFGNFYFLIFITLLLSWLMVSNIRLISLKFKSFTWSQNKGRYILLISSVLLIFLFQFLAIPFIMVIYLAISAFLKN